MDLQDAVHVLHDHGLALHVGHGPVRKVVRTQRSGRDADVGERPPGGVHGIRAREQPGDDGQEEHRGLRRIRLLVLGHAHGVQGDREPCLVHTVGHEVDGLGLGLHAHVAQPAPLTQQLLPPRMQGHAPGGARGGLEQASATAAQLHGPSSHPHASRSLHFEVSARPGQAMQQQCRGRERPKGPRHLDWRRGGPGEPRAGGALEVRLP
mmetsp:Transcript_34491/g.98984  ORF Transcript_34491/g.98984 Transcript_34491/m.98984 type:complete len:208 (-) Transcript_34491:18-641(-)